LARSGKILKRLAVNHEFEKYTTIKTGVQKILGLIVKILGAIPI
jgi:hypothetical protein